MSAVADHVLPAPPEVRLSVSPEVRGSVAPEVRVSNSLNESTRVC